MGLVEAMTSAPTLDTRTVREVVPGPGSSWVWEHLELFHDGAESHWFPEEEAFQSFSTLQLDVFHPLWEYITHGLDNVHPIRYFEHWRSQPLGMKSYRIFP